ncbi:MAG TPA: hypothetical protein VJ161_01995 [Geobacteraceae bacterium]|nr:hypothetical protein [Geobacteraceae bacterium]
MNFYERLIDEPIKGFLDRIVDFLPNILTAILILIFGLAAGWLTKVILRKILVVLKLDRLAEKVGFRRILVKGGLHEPLSSLLAKITGGFIVLAFLVVALGTLNIEVIHRLIERLFNYLPSIFFASVIISIGYVLGNFLGRATLIAAVNAGISMARFIGNGVKYLILFISISIALEQLGIGRDTVLISYAVVLSGFVLALAIAFGLGGRDSAKDFIERKLKGEERKNNINHL